MRTDDLDYPLPPALIAQEPAPDRADARLLHYRRDTRGVAHRRVGDLPEILRRGDLLVFNSTRVVPARFALRKPTGGLVDGLWLGGGGRRWHVLLRNLGRIDPDATLAFDADPSATLRVLNKRADDGYDAECSRDAADLLGEIGRMPLPPYIRRGRAADPRDAADRDRYQPVTAESGASVAAPTASLHFDPPLLARLADAGVDRTAVELTVGLGTFKPVTAADLSEHPMHRERWRIPDEAAARINAAPRVVAVGTTVCRTLESQPPGPLRPGEGETGLLIQPGHAFGHADALLTNFHLPRSTLLALVDAMIGTSERRRLYEIAVAGRYRFFSYGDCMLIE